MILFYLDVMKFPKVTQHYGNMDIFQLILLFVSLHASHFVGYHCMW